MTHSPKHWAPFGKQVIDSDQRIIAQCNTEQDADYIAKCVNTTDDELAGDWVTAQQPKEDRDGD